MVTRSLASFVAAIFIATACHQKPPTVAPVPAPNDHFSIVLERSANGWAAHCEAGCAWVTVSMACGGCDVRLDASGIGPAYPATSAATGFAFVLSADRTGGKARSIQGTRWTTLGWGCLPAACRVRLDETGVGVGGT
jgi:hypothetical protein